MTRIAKHKTNLIIAIDGPAGSGKSTVARLLAKALHLPFIDTGAMYRAVTLKAMKENIELTDEAALLKVARKADIQLLESRAKVILDGRDVTHSIRTPDLTKNVFYVAQVPAIRKEMVKKQRVLGKKSGAVMEGRDIGTVVFPKADFKFFLEADPQVRAQRRYKEIMLKGKQQITLPEVLRDLNTRDATDINRKEGPLKVAKGAIVIDTTPLTIKEVVDRILSAVRSDNTGSYKARAARQRVYS